MKFWALSAMAALLFFPSLSTADETGAITAHNAYAYATSQVQKNGAVFMEIVNGGAQIDRVTSATSDVAARVELHTHIMDGDIMMMREVERYELPAGETVTLEPMGHHIMLMGLKQRLEDGQHFPLTLTLETGAPITIDIEIVKPGHAP